MDLIVYEEADLTTARKPRAKKPTIIISARGKVSLNRQLLELLGVRTEDPAQPSARIAFAQDRRRPQDWYVRLSEKGLAVRRCGRGWAVYSRILSAAVHGSVRGAEWPLRIPVSETADDGWYASSPQRRNNQGTGDEISSVPHSSVGRAVLLPSVEGEVSPVRARMRDL